jgi:hypothetical protein
MTTPHVTVTPDTFRFVSFDADAIRRVAESIADAIGLDGREIVIVVDETTPLARTTVDVGDDTITIHAESGAFEDTRKPRQQSEVAVATALGRMLLRARDRIAGGFGEAPPDEELSLAQVAAWEAYSIGRLSRLGVATNQQRWRYNFRNRHGFSDAGDAAFDRLWGADGLTWGELDEISRSATAAAPVR